MRLTLREIPLTKIAKAEPFFLEAFPTSCFDLFQFLSIVGRKGPHSKIYPKMTTESFVNFSGYQELHFFKTRPFKKPDEFSHFHDNCKSCANVFCNPQKDILHESDLTEKVAFMSLSFGEKCTLAG